MRRARLPPSFFRFLGFLFCIFSFFSSLQACLCFGLWEGYGKFQHNNSIQHLTTNKTQHNADNMHNMDNTHRPQTRHITESYLLLLVAVHNTTGHSIVLSTVHIHIHTKRITTCAPSCVRVMIGLGLDGGIDGLRPFLCSLILILKVEVSPLLHCGEKQ